MEEFIRNRLSKAIIKPKRKRKRSLEAKRNISEQRILEFVSRGVVVGGIKR